MEESVCFVSQYPSWSIHWPAILGWGHSQSSNCPWLRCDLIQRKVCKVPWWYLWPNRLSHFALPSPDMGCILGDGNCLSRRSKRTLCRIYPVSGANTGWSCNDPYRAWVVRQLSNSHLVSNSAVVWSWQLRRLPIWQQICPELCEGLLNFCRQTLSLPLSL